MRKPLLLYFIFWVAHFTPCAQTLQNIAREAFLISRMVERHHVQPRALNNEFSSDLFTVFFESLDPQRIFFIREDMEKLSVYRFTLDDEIRNQKYDFLDKTTSLFSVRLTQVDSIIDLIAKTPFNFTLKENLTVAEDSSYAIGLAGLRVKIQKKLKLLVLNGIMEGMDPEAVKPAEQKAVIDRLEPKLRKIACSSFKRSLKRFIQNKSDLNETIGEAYCQALASCYDPHTAFFPKQVKDAFEASLGKKTMEYGLNFDEDEEGNVLIDDLKPGSSAFQSGQLNEGDKIQSVQIGSQTPQNVSELDVAQVYQIITNASDNKVTLTVKKPDGSSRQVILRKEIQELDDDENKVKSFILKGKKSIGYISLPAFYSDWEDSQGINGCANDVAKEIVKLKKDAIDGLILDVRYNGGGSMQEAIELAGIFIDAGPVGQYRSRDGKVITLKDGSRGTIYDGPLLLMVNGYSASASEMIAATLQDYNRALIVGSPTFGKATAQVILPLDTTIDLNTYDGTKAADSYIKLTISTLYRLNGTSAQINGVKPHIILPDIARASQQGEASEPFALRTIDIAANKYYKPLASLQLNTLESFAKSETEAPGFFSEVNRYLNQAKIKQQPRDQSLLLTDAIQNRKNLPVPEIQAPQEKKDKNFTITNHKFEIQRMQSNKALLEMNEERKNDLLTDPYIQIAFDLLLLMTK